MRAQVAAPPIMLMIPRMQTTPKEAEPVGNASLRDELHNMVERDQDVRNRWTESPADKTLIAECKCVDAANTVRMKRIVAQYGWPGKSLVGRKGAGDAFILVQHADRDHAFQRQCLPLLQKAAEGGEAALPNLALLTDRVLIADGKKQRYGSQLIRTPQGKWVTLPTEDEAHLDERRHAVQLPPIAEYIQFLTQAYEKQPTKEAPASGGKPPQ